MGLISRLKRIVTDKPPIRHGHVYTDVVTGERFEVVTVARWVEIERFDAERRPTNTVRKTVMRDAIKIGTVEHDEDSCPTCGSGDR